MKEAMGETNKGSGTISLQGLLLFDISSNDLVSSISTIIMALEGDDWLLGLNVGDGGHRCDGVHIMKEEMQTTTSDLRRMLCNNSSLRALVLPSIYKNAESLSINIGRRPWPKYIDEHPFLSSLLKSWRDPKKEETLVIMKGELW